MQNEIYKAWKLHIRDKDVPDVAKALLLNCHIPQAFADGFEACKRIDMRVVNTATMMSATHCVICSHGALAPTLHMKVMDRGSKVFLDVTLTMEASFELTRDGGMSALIKAMSKEYKCEVLPIEIQIRPLIESCFKSLGIMK